MNVLVACEESQEVCKAFRAKGHRAFSCDIQDCSGGHPEWHIQDDVLRILNGYKGGGYGCSFFVTNDGKRHDTPYSWDLIIAHPPCTYLTVSGNRWFNVEKYGEKAVQRERERERAIEFFMQFVEADCEKIAIENPIGIISTVYRKPDQIIQPYQFGHPYTKTTCLWLKNLPKLTPSKILEKPADGWKNQHIINGQYKGFGIEFTKSDTGKWLRYGDPQVAKLRSKTFPGIAKAMAEQWG